MHPKCRFITKNNFMKEKELENKTWYRAYKVIAILVVVAAFLAPSIQGDFSDGSLVDGIINILIWIIGFIILKNMIIYILYGKRTENK